MLKKNKKWILVCLISKVKTKQKDKQKNFESPTLFNPMDCSLPGSSVHGILQPRILEQVAISFSRGSSWPRDQTQVSCIIGRFFTFWAILYVYNLSIKNTSLKKKKTQKIRIPDEKTKVFLYKTYEPFWMFCYWHDTKAPSTYTPFLSLTENSGQNTKQLEDWKVDKNRQIVERSHNLEKWLHRDKILIVLLLSLFSLVALPPPQSLRVLQERQYCKWLKLQGTSCISGQRNEENECPGTGEWKENPRGTT